ncbi:hypothetical protein [Streptomyces phaeoluteigriseus]|uniref:hypothetical protein n=1 Tax=Streptomyces phaeoluteigriseus TaxID=114686 RepID=UPI001FEA370F|nr:hypothetical protein [Streptomyces phaeoluteigriseus]
MTTTDTAGPAAGVAPSWWAPAATLRERLSAPHPPAAPAAGPAAGLRTRSPIELTCDSVRSARLGADPRLMAALAAEPPARLAARLAKPRWAVFVEAAIAAAPRDARGGLRGRGDRARRSGGRSGGVRTGAAPAGDGGRRRAGRTGRSGRCRPR